MLNRRLVLSGLVASAAAASLPRSARASSQEMANDIAIVRQAIETLHPGLYRYLTPREATRGFERLANEFTRADDQAGRYLALSRFLATIKCGHSYANVFNQSKANRALLFDRPTRLPFAFLWLGDRMVITADHGSGVNLLPGTEVLRVNGVPVATMLRKLMPYARADGNNDAKRRRLLSVTGVDELEYFDCFQGLLFEPPRGGVHRLDLRLPNGKTRTTEAKVISLAERQARLPTARADNAPLWTWEMRPDGVAVLTMPDWVTYRTKWDWRGWLKERLDSLTSARGLIVDLRANEGGEDCGDPIISRFIANDFPLAAESRLVRFRQTPAELNRYLDTWDDSFRKLGENATPVNERFLRLERQGSNVIPAIGPRVTVPMVVLIGPQNSSATFQFARRCQKAGIAKLIGEPTGGNLRGINGGAFFFVRLPSSGLEFDLPLIGYFPDESQPDRGVLPDVLVATTAADIGNGRDAQLERALQEFR